MDENQTTKPIYCPRRRQHAAVCETPNACAGGADCRLGPDLNARMNDSPSVSNTTVLLPCPFCGCAVMPRHALWASDGDVDSIIHAAPSPECGLGDFSVYSADDGETIAAAWNRRAS